MPATKGFPPDDLRKILHEVRGWLRYTKWQRNIPNVSRVHERYRQCANCSKVAGVEWPKSTTGWAWRGWV